MVAQCRHKSSAQTRDTTQWARGRFLMHKRRLFGESSVSTSYPDEDLERAETSLKLPERGEPCFTFNSANLVNLVSEMFVDRRNLWSKLLTW
eukprot:4271679-Amphidinium_carterae.1